MYLKRKLRLRQIVGQTGFLSSVPALSTKKFTSKCWVGSIINFLIFLRTVFSLTDTHVPSTPGNKSFGGTNLLLKSANTNTKYNQCLTATDLKMESQSALESVSPVSGLPVHLQPMRMPTVGTLVMVVVGAAHHG